MPLPNSNGGGPVRLLLAVTTANAARAFYPPQNGINLLKQPSVSGNMTDGDSSVL